MSVIQKIRTKYAKLAGGVIAVALVAFILMDALSSRSGNLFGNDDSIVKVNGEKVDYITYTQRTKEYETLYSGSRTIDDEFRSQINGMALDDLVKEILIKEEAERIGLTVTAAERKDMIYGADPDQGVKSYQPFTNPDTKTFDPQYVKLFEEQADQLDPSGKARIHWETYKGFIQRNALVKKYNTLFAAAAYVPSFLAKANSQQQAEMASIDYVSIELENPDAEELELTDEDFNKYIKEHKLEFTTKDKTRSMQYVLFNVMPAAQDTARALGVLMNIKDEFANTTDNESFVNRNSEESFNEEYVMKDDYQSIYKDSIYSMSVGSVFGPVYEGESYKLVKMLDKKRYPDSVWCRHILINTAQRGQETVDDATAKARIDSIAMAIKSGTPFGEMVTKYSDDDGSKEKAGEYTFNFNQKSGLTKPFGDFIFGGKEGETKIVKVESSGYSGYHFIEILKQGTVKTAVQTGTISRALFAGDDTENEVFANANEFASSSTTATLFDSTANNMAVQILTAPDVKVNDFSIYNIGPCREIIRWMYNAEIGEVSQVFALNGKYVVSKLTDIKKPGLKKLDDELRNNLEPQVKIMKNKDMMAKKYENATSLEEIAKQTNKEILSADSFRGNNSFSGAFGYAPKIVGYAFCPELKENTLSKPIKEQSALYIVKLKNRFKDAVEDTMFVKKERETMQMEIKNEFGGQVGELLKKNADIKYNQDNF